MESSSASAPGRRIAPAELTLALMLASARCLVEDALALRSGVWQTTIGRELHGKVLGIVGYGGIGALVARYGAALGMHVLAWGRAGSLERARADGHEAEADLDALCTRSDVVSLHLKLSPETRGLLSARHLALMKPDALLVNTARAGLVERGALDAALAAGRPGSAAIDVFDEEPATADPLVRNPAVLATPHLGYVTWETYESYFEQAFAQVNAFAAGAPTGVVNPEARPLSRSRSDDEPGAAFRCSAGRTADRGPGRFDVAPDLGDELGLGGERPLVPKPLPDLDDEPLAVEIALEVEQVGLDPALGTAVVRVRADRDGAPGARARRRRRCRSSGRRDAARARGSPSGSRACRPAGRRRRRCRRARTAGRASPPPRRRPRHAGRAGSPTTRHPARSRPRGSRSRAARAARGRLDARPRSGSSPGRHSLRADPTQVALGEYLRLERHQLRREGCDSVASAPASSSSSSRRSSVEISSTWFPSAMRGCGRT